jgi:hypothetical protein
MRIQGIRNTKEALFLGKIVLQPIQRLKTGETIIISYLAHCLFSEVLVCRPLVLVA